MSLLIPCGISNCNFITFIGSYRCEISADAPSFAIDYTDQRMRVVGEHFKDFSSNLQ